MKKYILKTGFAIAMLVAFCAKASAYTAVASGNWSSAATWGGTAPGATVSAQDIVIPSSIHVVLDMNVSYSGTPINSFTVNGSLDNTTPYTITMVQGSLAGTGIISVGQITFQTLATSTFTGTMTLKTLMNSGATLVFTAIANITDTLNLDAGSMLLNAGANLTMKINSTVRMNSGTITIGGGTFNTGSSYNVLYVGASKTSGLELNSSSVQNLYIRMTDNSQTLTLAANLVVNGNLQMTAGIFDITARQLTLAGDLKMNSGSMFTSSSTSNMSLTGTASLTNGLAFTSGSAIGDLTISLTNNGKAKLMTALAVSGHLKLMNGSFSLESGSTLTMNAASTIHVEGGSMAVNSGTFVGTAAYNVEYMGGSNTSGTELTGSGLSNLSIALVGPSNSVKLKNSITVAGKLNITSGKLDLNGDTLTVNGTMWQSSAAPFIGSTSSSLVLNLTSVTDDTLYFDNSNQNLKRLKLNLTGGNIVLGTMLIINSEIDFVKGKLVLINSDLQVLAAALINGYDNAKYIATTGVGRLQMAVNSGSAFVTFPVGTLSNYSPAGIQQTASGATGNFMVRVMSGVLTNGTSGYNTANSASVVDRTWLIDAASGLNVNMNLKLAWVGAAEVNSFDRTHAFISHYKNSVWDTYATASASAGVNSTYELTRNGISSLSPFAVSDNNAAMGITENVNAVTSVEMYPNPSTDYLNIQITNSGGANYLYEIIDVTGRTVLTTANNNSLNRLSVSDFTTGCYFIKVTNLDTHSIITKRFIKS